MAQTAVVTGGSRGIGRAICVGLAKAGYNIVTCYTRGAEAMQETEKLCVAEGVSFVGVQCDIAKEEEATALITKAMDTFGSVEVLVNNAGITRDGLLLRMKEEDFRAVLDTNLLGAFFCTKAVSKIMLKQKYGRIISISSVVGLSGNAGQANYAASKAGLIAFMQSTAKELGGKGITANCVAPGFIETDMTNALPEETKKGYLASVPRKCFGKPEDVAGAVTFLASEQAGYITGQVISVDGGLHM